MGDLTVPKRRVEVCVELAGGLRRDVVLFVAGGAPGHPGGERVRDLLEDAAEFIPADDPAAGGITFLRSSAIVVAAAPSEPVTGTADEVTVPTEHEVDVCLDDGRVLHGLLSYVLPLERSRIIDYLNQPSRFLPLRRGADVLLVNKRHVTRIAAVER